jgi:hypothetical protein
LATLERKKQHRAEKGGQTAPRHSLVLLLLDATPQGVLDEYRRPKMAFDAVRAGFAAGQAQQRAP